MSNLQAKIFSTTLYPVEREPCSNRMPCSTGSTRLDRCARRTSAGSACLYTCVCAIKPTASKDIRLIPDDCALSPSKVPVMLQCTNTLQHS